MQWRIFLTLSMKREVLLTRCHDDVRYKERIENVEV